MEEHIDKVVTEKKKNNNTGEKVIPVASPLTLVLWVSEWLLLSLEASSVWMALPSGLE